MRVKRCIFIFELRVENGLSKSEVASCSVLEKAQILIMMVTNILHFTAIHIPNLLTPIRTLSSKKSSLSRSLASNFGLRLNSTSSSSSSMAAHLQVSEGAPAEDLGPSSSRAIGQHDLLIVGPGVLGRMVAQKWREVYKILYYSKRFRYVAG